MVRITIAIEDCLTSKVDSEAPLSFPTCRGPTDVVHLPAVQRPIPITFAHCRPAKQWLRALLPSGAYLGLALSASLSQTKTTGLMEQLSEKKVIDVPMWSLVLINGKEGIFSIGGTSAASVRQAEKETDEMLNPGEHDETKRDTFNSKAEDSLKDWRWLSTWCRRMVADSNERDLGRWYQGAGQSAHRSRCR